MMKLQEIVEGSTRIKIPIVEKLLKKNPVFYNPVMEMNRDISVAACQILKPETYCDALAGSGARGLRVAKEAGCDVTLVDTNETACKLMKKNARLNKLRADIVNDNCNHFLSDKKFDFVDIDPFGPPVRYLESAIRAMPKRGYIGVAATDTSALCGTYPRAGRRKYDSLSLRTDYYDELGLRILLGFVARLAVRYERGARVLFSHSTRHYFRAYVELFRSRNNLKETQDSIGYVQHCFKCLERSYKKLGELERKCACGAELSTAGPLWTRTFADKRFCESLNAQLADGAFNRKEDAIKLIERVRQEQEILKPYYDFHKVCKREKKSVPRYEPFFEKLMNRGFSITRTHFSDLGIRTDAGVEEIAGLL